MIKYIIGDVKHIGLDHIVVDNSGLGYKIWASDKTLIKFEVNKNYLVHIYMAVREDSIDLYGFFDDKELEFFELLISVTSIGPKNALSILSSLEVDQIQKAINTNDINLLTQAKGVGKKTASRIILELSDKVSKLDDLDLGQPVSFTADLEASIDALTNLGYPRNEVIKAMNKVETDQRDIEDIIKDCIIVLSSK